MVGNICLLSPLVLSNLDNLALLSFDDLFGESLLIFPFLYDRIYIHFKLDIILNFSIQKLKNERTFPQKIYKLAKVNYLNLTEREGHNRDTLYLYPFRLLDHLM